MKIYFAGMVAGLILTGVNAHAATPSLWKNHYLDANGHLWVWGGGLAAAYGTFGLQRLPTSPVQIASGFDRLDSNGYLYKTDGSAWQINQPLDVSPITPALPTIQFLGYGIKQLQKGNGFDLALVRKPFILLRNEGLLWDGTGDVWRGPATSPAADRLIGAGLYRSADGRIFRQVTGVNSSAPVVFNLAYDQQPSLKAAWSFIGEAGQDNIGNGGLAPHLGISLAITDQNTLLGWGSNINGLLLNSRTTDRAMAEALPLGEGYIKALFGGGSNKRLSGGGVPVTDYNPCGEGYIVALKQDGTIWSWGSNWAGQLGTGDIEPRTTPTLATAVGGDYIDFHRAGNCSMVGLKRDGTLWAWGEAKDSPLGDAARTGTADHLAFSGPGSKDLFPFVREIINTQVIKTKPLVQAQQVVFPAVKDMTIPTPVLDIQATSTGPLNKRSITVSITPLAEDNNFRNKFYILALLSDGTLATLSTNGWLPFAFNQTATANDSFLDTTTGARKFNLTNEIDLTALRGTAIFVGYSRANQNIFEVLAFGRWKHVLTLE